MAKDSEITIISVGPGAPDMITLRALRAIENQDVIVASADTAAAFADGMAVHVPQKLVSGTLDFISSCPHRKIGVLVTGDAGFFSMAASVIKNFDKVSVIPGVSSVNFAFAEMRIDWSNYRFISVHGREMELPEINENTVILCDGRNTPDKILATYPQLADNFDITILKDLSLKTQAIYKEPQGSYESSRLILVLTEKAK